MGNLLLDPKPPKIPCCLCWLAGYLGGCSLGFQLNLVGGWGMGQGSSSKL